MSGPVGVEGAENPSFFDAIPEESHTLAGILLIDETHFVDPVGGIIQEHEKIIKDSRLVRDPFVRAAVEVKHHAGEGFSGASGAMLVAFPCFIDFSGGLQKFFNESVTAVDVVMLFEFFVEMGGVETFVVGPVELQDGLDL